MNFRIRNTLTALLLAGLVAGCGSSVALQTPNFPRPLANKIPMTVGLRMPANFHGFVHEEEVYGREQWSIDLADSNAALFTQLFGHMFDDLKVLTPNDDPKLMDIDALIEPSIDAFEFSVPNQSKTDSFAVWIRYRLKIYDGAGELQSTWPVSAYGKSQTASMSNTEALRRAAILAMRDAAALMIMKLDDAGRISSLARPKTPAAIPAVAPIPSEDDGADTQTTAVEGQEDESS